MNLNKVNVNRNCLIDLHLHIDGSISVSSARRLAEIQKIQLPDSDNELSGLLSAPYGCSNLNDYLKAFELPLTLLQSYEALSECVCMLADELCRQGLMYAELRFAPQLHIKNGLSQENAVQAVLEGIERSGFFAKLILCCMRRENNKSENIETVMLAEKYLNRGVCAIDLAGAEAVFPNQVFKYVFDLANGLGIPFTIHSGEALGAKSIISALDFGAKRIGHGVRCIENKNLVDRIIKDKICLEICPTSNVDTCVFKNVKDEPIGYLFGRGAIITINTDDMAVSRTTLKNELKKTADAFSLTDIEIKKLLLNSVTASFTSAEEKKLLSLKIESEYSE